MLRVFVMSKENFDNLMLYHGINDSNVESYDDMAIISINDTIGGESKSFFGGNHDNVLIQHFDDVSEDMQLSPTNSQQTKAFTYEQAEELVNFVNRNKDKGLFLVHCAAGISRSGAVGQFIIDYLNGDKEIFKRYNPNILPNPYIRSILWKWYLIRFKWKSL